MTSTVIVRAHTDPMLVRLLDVQPDGSAIVTHQYIITPADGPQTFNCWLDRRVECIDVPPDFTLVE